jgi:Na+-translocating ferredoxin:NAD+ oxidoreductase RnfC subunit
MYTSIYITDTEFNWLLSDLNIAYDQDKKDDLLKRAIGDFEADMSKKYIVPLIDKTGVAYTSAPAFAQNKVLNAVKAKVRQLIGVDKNRNLVIESTERYIDTHKIEYNDNVKTLLDPMIDFGFMLLNQAQDAQTPVQHLALSKACHQTELIDDPYI